MARCRRNDFCVAKFPFSRLACEAREPRENLSLAGELLFGAGALEVVVAGLH